MLKQARELKEAYCEWFDWAKTSRYIVEVKSRLEAQFPAFLKALKPIKNGS